MVKIVRNAASIIFISENIVISHLIHSICPSLMGKTVQGDLRVSLSHDTKVQAIETRKHNALQKFTETVRPRTMEYKTDNRNNVSLTHWISVFYCLTNTLLPVFIAFIFVSCDRL